MKLSDIAIFVTDKVSSRDISIEDYITTDCILQNKKGRVVAANLPPKPCSLTRYQTGDVLIANIRPYLKKIWYADRSGGASSDVLVLRAKENHSPAFLYSFLLQDSFFDYIMLGTKGSKMPRGDKSQIMRYETPFSPKSEEDIGKFFLLLNNLIVLNESINNNLEALANLIYDFWFVQFDFPDENGRPYKSSGGKMVWNEMLKRDIPATWTTSIVKDVIKPLERGISYASENISSPNGWPMINLACYSKQGDYREGEMKYYSGTIKETDKAFPYDMLIACTDMTQDADVIGRPILASEEFEWYVYSMDLAKITPDNIQKMYLYYTLRTPFYHKYIKPFASGTNVKHLNVLGVENYKIPIPPISLQTKFEVLISNIKKQQMLIINENKEIIKERDDLLPLLMNGQVSLK